jgi:glutathione S-transferase
LKELSSIPTLPLLSTDEGNFTNSNTIIRYLATKNEYKLYGENLHERALIDQWLDLNVCDFDTCVVAVNVYLEGKEVDIDKVIEDAEKFLTHLNRHLKNRKYLVGDSLTIADLAIAATIAPVLSHMYG